MGERAYMCFETENHRLETTPTRITMTENHQRSSYFVVDRRGMSYSFFSMPNEETTARLQRGRASKRIWENFFAIDRENMGVYKTCTVT